MLTEVEDLRTLKAAAIKQMELGVEGYPNISNAWEIRDGG